jgi:leucyl-tRNA synthetase
MEFTNHMTRFKDSCSVSSEMWCSGITNLLILLAPTAPHMTEELWHRLGHEGSIHNQQWPKWDEALAKEEEITLVVQVNGKLRDRINVPVSITEDEAKDLALNSEKAKTHIAGKQVVNVIYVPGRLVNVVVK